ncbi:nucleolar protein,Nop52-domain-containing protein [Nemania sp. FL0916]|nr:nucleolar protein,Nop52-domain-containing protein [Nemania sp. FL0916]
MAAINSDMPFIRNLASSDRKTRTAALQSLRTFLSASTATSRLSAVDNLKLWKGLYYSLWMCDRALPQQSLCSELADLIDSLQPAYDPHDTSDIDGKKAAMVVGGWLAAFWETLGREWTSIDALRLDKFLLLVRRVLGASLKWAACLDDTDADINTEELEMNSSGGSSRTRASARRDALLSNLAAWPLDVSSDLSRMPVGLRLHVLDIWVDEAEKLGLLDDDDDDAISTETEKRTTSSAGRELIDGLRLLVEAQSKSTCKPVRLRAKESLKDERLPWNQEDEAAGDDEVKRSAGAGSGDGDGWDGFDD